MEGGQGEIEVAAGACPAPAHVVDLDVDEMLRGHGHAVGWVEALDGPAVSDVEGQAERIEYDERSELVRLYSNAVVKELENDRMTNQMTGPFISYDNRKEVVAVRNDVSGESKVGGGRGTLILAPKRAPAGGTQ